MALGKKLGVSAAVVMVGIALVVGYRAFFPEPAEPDIETLCKYIAKSATGAQCTAAIAPEGFPVGNVVVVPDPPTPGVPLPAVLRSFAQTCWLDPDKAAEVAKQLNRPAVEMTLPGFTADISRKLKSGASVTLAEADNLKIIAGSHSDGLRNVSVSPRNAQAIQMDQALVESLLHRPEIREDCLERLLRTGTRLVVSVIVAKGINYTVTSTNDDHMDLDAAVKTGYINVDGGPQANAAGKIATTLSEENPRVIGAVFADKMMIADPQNLIRKGNIISSTGKSQVKVSTRLWDLPGWPAEATAVSETPRGLFSLDQTSIDNSIRGLSFHYPDVGLRLVNSEAPRANGSSLATAADGLPDAAGGGVPASVKFDMRADLVPGSFVWTSLDPSGGRRLSELFPKEMKGSNHAVIDSPIRFGEMSEGSFKVLKRLDGPETLAVNITSINLAAAATDLGDIIVRVQDASHRDLRPEFTRPVKDIGPQGISFQITIDQAGLYNVNAVRRTNLLADSHLSINTSVKVEVNLSGGPRTKPESHT